MESRDHRRLRTTGINPSQNTISLQQLVHVGGITNAALVKVVKQLRNTPDVVVSRRLLQETNLDSFIDIRHVQNIPMLDGTNWEWETSDPNKLLAYLARNVLGCPTSSKLLRSSTLARPSRLGP